jgi:hypothetical protein
MGELERQPAPNPKNIYGWTRFVITSPRTRDDPQTLAGQINSMADHDILLISNCFEHTHDHDPHHIYLIHSLSPIPPFPLDGLRAHILSARSLTKIEENYKSDPDRLKELRLALSGHMPLDGPAYPRHEGAAENEVRMPQDLLPKILSFDQKAVDSAQPYFGGSRQKTFNRLKKRRSLKKRFA